MRRTARIGLLLCLVGCGSADGNEATSVPATSASPGASASTPEPPVAEPGGAEPPVAQPPVAPEPAPGAVPVAEPATAPAVDGARVLADCLWFADALPPPVEGPGSLAELDARVSSELGRDARVVGRVRLAARGCPRLSAGVVVVRNAADVSGEDDEDLLPLAIAGDEPGRAPVAGARGDERRDGPWLPPPAESPRDLASCDGNDPPAAFLFRARHAATGAVESIFLDPLVGDACGFYGHDLQHGDLDRDGTTELRVETYTGGYEEMTAGASSAHRLWIYDLAEMRAQLAIEVGGHDTAEVVGYFDRATRGAIALRDVDADGDRDVIVRRFAEGYQGSESDTYREWTTEVHAYDAPTDTYRRAPELDARVTGRD